MSTKPLSPDRLQQLIVRAQANDTDAAGQIIASFDRLLRKLVGQFLSIYKRVPAYEFEDLVQEGRLAALKAIRAYDPERSYTLGTLIGDCVRNRLLTLVEAANRDKRRAHYHTETLDVAGGAADFLSDPGSLSSFAAIDLIESCRQLTSGRSRVILERRLAGHTTSEIAAELDLLPSTVDILWSELCDRLRAEILEN